MSFACICMNLGPFVKKNGDKTETVRGDLQVVVSPHNERPEQEESRMGPPPARRRLGFVAYDGCCDWTF